MSSEAGLVAILVLFPIYLLYVGKFQTYASFASTPNAQPIGASADNGLNSNAPATFN